jgi:YD repeat-containing protein
MRSVLIGAIALMAILLPSCNKEVSPLPTTGLHKKLIKSAFSGYSKDTITYKYDGTERLLEVNSHSDNYSFTYIGDSVKVKDFRPDENRLVYDGTGVLDISKKIKSLSGDAVFAINSPYKNTTTFEYNGNGYLQKRTDSRSNGKVYTYNYTWIDGDISHIDCLENGTLLFYNTFEYFNTQDLRGVESYKFDSQTTDLVGDNSKHLLKKASTYLGNNTLSVSYNYTYTLDGQGYPSKATLTSSYGDVSNVVYTYGN